MQNQFRFSLLGSNIELRSNSDLVYMERVFRHLEQKMASTQEALKLNDALKTAIITAFLLVDDLLIERAKLEELLPRQDGLEAEKLVNALSHDLKELLQKDK
ncbi:hypothetical protein P0082_08095 [Candidatus Haliotispira prima]|uniref:Cell division protein ZapA n=1 Tax=Candidatus Haliotispira prima TaxID=3034016 RepID=A0ABY8MFY2_9SPIO|nr:hypothetical protein P0082_08095 [Candidatus Haliotispira prima]